MAIKNYNLKLKVAKYYYEYKMTQQEIAEKINVSRPTVSKLLKQAKEENIVQINIVDIENKTDIIQIEENLENQFDLDEVIIAECNNENNKFSCIGKKAAEYFERIVEDNLSIGLSWGRTLRAMMNNLSENKQISGLEVVTLVGGSGDLTSNVHSNILANKILKNYDGSGYYLYAPAIVDSEEVCNAIMSNKETKRILEKACQVDVAFVGIGSPIQSSNLLKTGYFQEKEIKELTEHGMIGDICSRFFDANGNTNQISLNHRAIGITLEKLKKINRVVGIAGGKEKVRSIKGAMQGGFIDVLITDRFTAESLNKGIEKNVY